MRTRRNSLVVEWLEDRTAPAGLADALASASIVADAPVGRINIVSAAGESTAFQAALAASPYAASVNHVGFGIYNVTLTSGIEAAAAATFYSSVPGVAAAEPDYVIQVNRTPNDPSYSSLYGMAQISAPAAWDNSTGSGNFVVAVIDSGVDYNHPDLAANMWHNPNETPNDGIDNDGNGIVDDYYGANFVGANTGNPMDDNGHGTHVAGTIGAVGNNGTGVAGVNWNVKIMALKFLSASGSGSTSDAIEALNYAVAHGAKVSNNSWGGGGYSTALFNAIQAAQNAGHIFVAAAGNSNVNIDTTPSYPASYNLGNVVAVASTTSTDARSSFSNYGPNTVDIAAPGSSILSTTPNNTYSVYSGTSMATPHVTGAIALYWDANPTASAADVIAKLKSSADVVTGLSGYVEGGRRLNVSRMLEPTSPPPPPPADTTGARVTAASFPGTTSLASVRFTFNEAIDPASFTLADIASFTGPNGAITATAVNVVAGTGNTQFDVTFPPQTAGGTYSVTIGPDILDAAGNAVDQNQNGANGEATADRYTASRTLSVSNTYTFSAGGLPLAIRDFTYTRATIAVNQDITISDVNVRFSASHTYDSDLIVKLIGPGGQVATLVNRRGGSRDNFTNTTLDDEASTAISAGAAPFTGTFRPESTLTVFDGRNARGTWTLEVYDAAGQDVGSLTAFTLIVTGTNGTQSVTAFGMKDEPVFLAPAATQSPAALEADLPTPLAAIALPPEPRPAFAPPIQYLPPSADTADPWSHRILV
ncbi:MAG: S8 family serine peptidase [Gemmataceae bacterium]